MRRTYTNVSSLSRLEQKFERLGLGSKNLVHILTNKKNKNCLINLQHAADDFLEFGGHDDEALDGHAYVLQTGSDGLQQLVEATHLLDEHRIHALTVRRRILEQT